MIKTRLLLAAAAFGLCLGGNSALLGAQALTTGSISGVVRDSAGVPVTAAQVQVINRSTGATTGAITRDNGSYTVVGLAVGGPYSVIVRRIGFQPTERTAINVSLGQAVRVDFNLAHQVAVLSGVQITAVREQAPIISPTKTGVGTSITDSALHRLPTLNRDFTEFVQLSPQVASNSFGLSGGGANYHYNQIQIDGATEADLFGLGSTGQPGGSARARSIPLESVKEYQILLSPYDVRQGNFAGVLINAVTRSGTNKFDGTAYYTGRNQSFTRNQPYINDFSQQIAGFALGGPIIKDRVFFFVNPEFQRRTEPPLGAYLTANSASPGLALTPATVQSFRDILTKQYGLPDPGTAGLVNNTNPLNNLFARLDFVLPAGLSAVLRENYDDAANDNFSRGNGATPTNFRLTSNKFTYTSLKHALVGELRKNWNNGIYNEFLGGYTTVLDRRNAAGAPAAQVTVFQSGQATLIGGTERYSLRNEVDQRILELTDNLTIPIGSSHRLTIGTQNQFFKARNLYGNAIQGVWSFGSLDSLQMGQANSYIVGIPAQPGSDGSIRLNTAQYSAYAEDQWTVSPTLNVTGGLRVDIPTFRDKPPFNPAVLAAYGRNTSDVPSGIKQYSPRLGFNWDVTGDQQNQLRGGIGVFVGRPAFVWLANAIQNSGLSGVNVLTCDLRSANKPPQFNATNANPLAPASACANGTTAKAAGEIDLVSKNLRFPQTARASLGYDRALGDAFVLTLEGLYTKGLNNFFYQDISLAGPVGYDVNGRVVYGPKPSNPARVGPNSPVLDVTNESKDYSYDLTTQITRRFLGRFEGSLAYTYSQAYDVQSLTSSTAYSQTRYGRVVSGDVTALTLAPSTFNVPHRVVATGSYSFPTKTDLSFTYIGQSGNSYSFISSGDLNADGFTQNDPIYIPTNARDTTQIRFAPVDTKASPAAQANSIAQQQASLESFINKTPCLNDHRGQISQRNACHGPWTNIVNVSLRQRLPNLRGQHASVELQVFNFLNLLNSRWGHVPDYSTQATVLNYKTTLTSPAAPDLAHGAVNSFTFTNPQIYNPDVLASNYQMQLALRYSF